MKYEAVDKTSRADLLSFLGAEGNDDWSTGQLRARAKGTILQLEAKTAKKGDGETIDVGKEVKFDESNVMVSSEQITSETKRAIHEEAQVPNPGAGVLAMKPAPVPGNGGMIQLTHAQFGAAVAAEVQKALASSGITGRPSDYRVSAD